MYMNKSSIENFLEQHKPLSENEMQLLTRRVVMNLTKNALLQTSSKAQLPATTLTAIKKLDNATFLQNFATEARPKQKLLRYPAFPLEETIPKFLKSVEPILNEEEMKQTEQAANSLLNCEGKELQALLEVASKCEENWLADRWLRVAYLRYRDPVTVHSSPGMPFPLQTFDSDEEYICYTSKLIYLLIKYKELVDNGEIPVVKMGKLELDNSQFERVYGTCRIPKFKEDCLQYNPNSRHVAVIYRNHFYKLPVYNNSCKPLHISIIAEQLKNILQAEKVNGPDFGILTTDHRDNWAAAYSELITIPGNQEHVKEIQKSLFTVSLDQEVPMERGINCKNVMSAQTIHGGGSKQNGGNRWMDKTIQVLVSRNGISGFCYEHSPAEGQPIALMTDYIFANLKNTKFFDGAATTDYECANKLELKSSPCLDEHIGKSKQNLDKLAGNLHLSVLHYKTYGKGFLKKQKMSPDSFIQMAFQYAFYKLHQKPGNCYESAHLRIYFNGRTETIRSCSNESIAFAKAMCDPNCSDEVRADLMRKAVKGHRDYTTMALQGRGVDRHLLGLKLMAIENNKQIPKLYETPGFGKSLHFRLSTSQVASVYESFMAYGPSAEDGYAICYNPRENDIICSCSSFNSNEETDADCLAEALCDAFNSMQETLLNAGEPPKAKL